MPHNTQLTWQPSHFAAVPPLRFLPPGTSAPPFLHTSEPTMQSIMLFCVIVMKHGTISYHHCPPFLPIYATPNDWDKGTAVNEAQGMRLPPLEARNVECVTTKASSLWVWIASLGMATIHRGAPQRCFL
jgi:hypothetical protein